MSAPPASIRDWLRTASVVARLAPPLAVELALDRTAATVRCDRLRPVPSTTTQPGLAAVRAFSRRALERFGIETEVLHDDRVPPEGGLLLMWNQQSHLDHLLLGTSIPRPFASLYNNGVARTPLYGEFLRRNGHFHVDREDETQWRASVARAADALRGGRCILVSPEGTRSRGGVLLPMKRGAFILARAAERPVVCVTLVGAHARLPRDRFAVTPGRIRVVFSEPIEVRAEDESLEQQVVDTFESLMRKYAL
jgi:1-acyl-sn-glycerol-3-phosphate acyltransferase